MPHGHVQRVDWTDGENWTAKIHLRTPCCIKLRTLAASPFQTNLKCVPSLLLKVAVVTRVLTLSE